MYIALIIIVRVESERLLGQYRPNSLRTWHKVYCNHLQQSTSSKHLQY